MQSEPEHPPFTGDPETRKRAREVQLLVNIIEPDPEYQPAFVSDEATLLDCLGTPEDEMLKRLAAHFGSQFDHDLRQPVWKFVDQLKVSYIGWPDRNGAGA